MKPVIIWTHGLLTVTAGTSWVTFHFDGELLGRVRGGEAELADFCATLLRDTAHCNNVPLTETLLFSHWEVAGRTRLIVDGTDYEFPDIIRLDLVDWFTGHDPVLRDLGGGRYSLEGQFKKAHLALSRAALEAIAAAAAGIARAEHPACEIVAVDGAWLKLEVDTDNDIIVRYYNSYMPLSRAQCGRLAMNAWRFCHD